MENLKLSNSKPDIKRIDATSTWELRQRVMWANKPLSFVQLPNDHQGIHYGLFIDNQLVSVVSVFIDTDNQDAQFRKFCTDKNFQHQGLGSLLLTHLIQETKESGIRQLWCDARTSAIAFYQKFGMKTSGEIFIKNDKEYIKMQIEL